MENQKNIPGISSGFMEALQPGANAAKSMVHTPPNHSQDFQPERTPGISTPISELSGLKKEEKHKRQLKGLSESKRSDLVEEVLQSPPNSLIRWGSTWILVILFMLLAISWFVEYPDLVKGKLQVVSDNMAKTVIAKKEGLLEKLNVKDNELVKKGQVLGKVESLADEADVYRLKAWLANFEKTKQIGSIPVFNNLGELQADFQNFANNLGTFSQFAGNGIINQKIGLLNRDIRQLEEIADNLLLQSENLQKDTKLALEEFNNQQRLFQKGIISQNELRAAESKYINKKQLADQAASQFNSNAIQINQKRNELLEIRKNDQDQTINFEQELNKLQTNLENWERTHYLIAPTDGRLMFFKHIQVNQQLSNAEKLFFVVPKKNEWHGEMAIGQYNIGKVKEGQRVILKFDGFPYQEYGILNGTVSAVSEIPIDSVYLVKVNLPESQKMKKEIKLRVGMTADGEIVTEELRLIEKIFYEIRKYINQ